MRPDVTMLPTMKLLQLLRVSKHEILSSKDLRERVGPEWRDALTTIRAQGYLVDEIVGNGGSRSYRLSPECWEGPDYLNESYVERKQRVTLTPTHEETSVRVNLYLDDVKRLLTMELPPRVRDVLVGAYMKAKGD